MSTLTSLVKSGKRKIIRTKAGQPAVERERDDINTQQKLTEASGSKTPILSALGRPDRGVSTDATRPQQGMLNPNDQTALGRPDQRVLKDPTRAQQGIQNSNDQTALGRPDRRVLKDPIRPS